MVLAANLPRVVSGLTWNADFVSQMVIAESIGQGAGGRGIVVQIGWLWFDVLTRPLPGHRLLWEYAPYALALGAVALLAAASHRLAGAWAAALTAALALAASPLVLSTQAAQAFHGTTWFGSALLAWFLPRLLSSVRPAEWVAVGLAGGALAATDPMLVALGVAPFAGAVLLGAGVRGGRGALKAGLALATLTVMTAAGLFLAFRAAGFTGSLPAGLTHTVEPGQLGYQLQVFTDGLRQVFGGWLLALLTLVPPAWAVVAWRTHQRPEILAQAAYWALAELLLAVGFLFSALPSQFGPPAARYLVPFFYAVVATLPVWMATMAAPGRREAVGVTAALFCLANALQIVNTDFGGDAGRDQLIASLDQRGLTRGYASYWTAAPSVWRSELRIQIAPVSEDPSLPDERCGDPLCPFPYNSLSDWYRPRPGTRSFVVTHPNVDYMRRPPPPELGSPVETYEAGGYTVYVYADDVAARMHLPPRFTRPLF